MDTYNVLVEKDLRLGNGSITVLTIAFTGVTDIKAFKEAMVKAKELFDKSDDNDDAYDEFRFGNYQDAGSGRSFYYSDLAEYRYQFEEGKTMFALT